MSNRIRAPRRIRVPRITLAAVALVVMLGAPFYIEGDWLFLGILCMAMAIGAVGLTVLVGTAGQLSLAHGFFVAIGAYGYALLSGKTDDADLWGLGWPPVLAAVGAVLLSAIAGLIFSPVAARLKGLYLGLASLALVFIGQHVLATGRPLTGGPNGRSTEPFAIGQFELSGSTPDFVLLGVPLEWRERLWYLALIGVIVAIVVATRVVKGRTGRALQLVRDNPSAAAAMGVNVQRAKAEAFVFSSGFGGAAGVILALSYRFIVPQSFDINMSVNFLAMVIIGGLGSVWGAVAGAAFVTSLPLLIDRFSGVLPFISQPGSGGITAGLLSQIIYGIAIVLILVREPGGLADIARRVSRFLNFPAKKRTPTPTPSQQMVTGIVHNE